MPSADLLTASSTSSDLLTLVRRHDPDGWRRFVSLYGPLVYEWCRRWRLDAADAGDVTQEVFTAVFKTIHDFRHTHPGDTLRGWLHVICRNKTHDHFRRRLNAPQTSGGSSAQEALEQLAEQVDDEAVVITERQALVQDAAALVRGEFESQTWQAFWLVAVEHLSAAEAAAQLHMTPGAVRQAKYIVLRRLREELSGEFD